MGFEYKYILYKNLESRIDSFCNNNGHLDPNCFDDSGYKIESIYKFFWNSNDKHGKIRLRMYTTSKQNFYFVEEKMKENDFVSKTRIKIEEKVYHNLCYCANESVFFLLLNQLNFPTYQHPSMSGEFNTYTVRYHRTPWMITLFGNEYRLTIDRDVCTSYGDNSLGILEPDKRILEIKGAKEAEIPIRFINQEYGLVPEKISKYKLASKIIETAIKV
ncbi:VTC domain-containing protein [Paenibacillus sp. FSL P2-0173]|uniref:VTC domain-containing protein n=1 Tax=Paenibacillus sp. FSL P2-0173 TaxID=2921627 RepID=UPI0030FBA647